MEAGQDIDGSYLEFSSALDGFCHRHFVRIFQITADRQSQRQARNPDSKGLNQSREIKGCRLAFDIRVRGDDHFFDRLGLKALQQGSDGELIRGYPLKGRKRPHQDVVPAIERVCFLYREDIVRFFHDTEELV